MFLSLADIMILTVRVVYKIHHGFNYHELEQYNLYHSHADVYSVYENDNTLD